MELGDVMSPILRRQGSGIRGGIAFANFLLRFQHQRVAHARRGVEHHDQDDALVGKLHFLAAAASAFVLEYCVEDSPLLTELVQEQFPLVDGQVTVPDAPGLGVTLDEDVIERYRV